MRKIGILEDDEAMGKELSYYLDSNGYEARWIEPAEYAGKKPEELVRLLLDENLHLLLLDIGLPGINGLHVCKEFRKETECPVIMITSKNDDLTELMAINNGADDFVAKPFNPQILIAHMESVLKRTYKTVATSEAYLTFCLPVKPTEILTSKLIVGVIWELLSVGVMLVSIYVMLTIQGSDIPQKAFDVLGKVAPILATEYGSVAFFFIHMGLLILIASIAGTLAFFLSICLGQLFNEHRVIMSIAMYVGVYTVSQILSVIVFMPFLLSDPKAMIVGKVSAASIDFAGIPTLGFFLSVGALQLALGAVYFIVCRIILKKKMNVR